MIKRSWLGVKTASARHTATAKRLSAARRRRAALIHGLIAKEICDYRNTGVVAGAGAAPQSSPSPQLAAWWVPSSFDHDEDRHVWKLELRLCPTALPTATPPPLPHALRCAAAVAPPLLLLLSNMTPDNCNLQVTKITNLIVKFSCRLVTQLSLHTHIHTFNFFPIYGLLSATIRQLVHLLY